MRGRGWVCDVFGVEGRGGGFPGQKEMLVRTWRCVVLERDEVGLANDDCSQPLADEMFHVVAYITSA